ncbi:MAG: helix-turn-helix transcriptional regulator [Planctomycetes bacterium]|nr:helix-turn-helix transcriptional regulator [Planctomycetota bacterium]MCD7898094.1 helix-turn-helix transcriptional regulator [Planctomycetaceae bacterium]
MSDLAELAASMPMEDDRANGVAAPWRERAVSAATPAVLHNVVLPGLALALTNIVMYSGMVSLRLRATGTTRLLVMTVALFSGVALGNAVIQRFVAESRTGTASSPVHRAILILTLGLSAATVLPGFHQYVTNELLRYAGTFAHALLIAPTYYLVFTRFPCEWRGRCFGMAWFLGMACWSLLSAVARAVPYNNAETTYHPLQPTLYLVHGGSIILLAGICLYCFVFEKHSFISQNREEPYIRPGQSVRRRLTLLLTAVPVVMFFLNGILGARLTPSLFASADASLYFGFSAAMAVAAPLAGWLMDRSPRNLPRIILPVCCGLFLFAPTLAAMNTGHKLHLMLQPLTAAAQYIVFAMCSVAVAGLADNARTGTALATRIYFLRIVNPLVLLLWGPVLAISSGVTEFAATLTACFMLALSWKISLPATTLPETDSAIDSNMTSQVEGNLEAKYNEKDFLSSADLSPREREVAGLILEGKTTLDIAFALGISERTVKKHCANVFRKFGVANAQALYLRCFVLAGGTSDTAESNKNGEHS